MVDVGIQIEALAGGAPCAYDGQWLVEYDPTRPGVDPDGRPMTAHVVCSPDPAEAMRFHSIAAARRLWASESGWTRPDGKPDRPLTAFTVVVEALPDLT